MIILVLIKLGLAKQMQFVADAAYLHVYVKNNPQPELSIQISQNGSSLAQMTQNYTDFLELFYPLTLGRNYNLEITIQPDVNFSAEFVNERQVTCLNGITSKDSCLCQPGFYGYEDNIHNSYNCGQIVNYIQQNSENPIAFRKYSSEIALITGLGSQEAVIQISPPMDAIVYGLNAFPEDLINGRQLYSGLINQNTFEGFNYIFIILTNRQDSEVAIEVSYVLQEKHQLSQTVIILICSIGSALFAIIGAVVIYMIKQKKPKPVKIEKPIDAFQLAESNRSLLCFICYSPQSDPCRQLPCSHIVHATCLEEWMMKNYRCPQCSIVIDELTKISIA